MYCVNVSHRSNTVVTHVNSGQPVVASTVVPVASTTPPHFSNHTTATITEVQAHQAVSQALSHVDSSQPPTPQSQPVEFNHAINYVNKIKVGYVYTYYNKHVLVV